MIAGIKHLKDKSAYEFQCADGEELLGGFITEFEREQDYKNLLFILKQKSVLPSRAYLDLLKTGKIPRVWDEGNALRRITDLGFNAKYCMEEWARYRDKVEDLHQENTSLKVILVSEMMALNSKKFQC